MNFTLGLVAEITWKSAVFLAGLLFFVVFFLLAAREENKRRKNYAFYRDQILDENGNLKEGLSSYDIAKAFSGLSKYNVFGFALPPGRFIYRRWIRWALASEENWRKHTAMNVGAPLVMAGLVSFLFLLCLVGVLTH